jgi:hypothetical protein
MLETAAGMFRRVPFTTIPVEQREIVSPGSAMTLFRNMELMGSVGDGPRRATTSHRRGDEPA